MHNTPPILRNNRENGRKICKSRAEFKVNTKNLTPNFKYLERNTESFRVSLSLICIKGRLIEATITNVYLGALVNEHKYFLMALENLEIPAGQVTSRDLFYIASLFKELEDKLEISTRKFLPNNEFFFTWVGRFKALY